MVRESLRTISIVSATAAITSCYTVHNEDLFPIERAALADTDVSAALSRQVYNSPPMLDKHFLELHGVSHRGYFSSEQFWAAAAPFLCRAAPAA